MLAPPLRAGLAPSFYCDRAASLQERLICADNSLGVLDLQMSGLYALTLDIVRPSDALKRNQGSWIVHTRNRCAEAGCLASSYKQRIEELFRLLNRHTTPIVGEASGTVSHPPGESPYCKLNPIESYYSIRVVRRGSRVEGGINGIYDCGRKIWGTRFNGHLRGNVAVVSYAPDFAGEGVGRAFVALRGNRLFWREFQRLNGESYVPPDAIIPVLRRKR